MKRYSIIKDKFTHHQDHIAPGRIRHKYLLTQKTGIFAENTASCVDREGFDE